MVKVVIWGSLRAVTDGEAEVEVEAATFKDVLRQLEGKHQRNPLFFGLMCPVILARGYRIGGL